MIKFIMLFGVSLCLVPFCQAQPLQTNFSGCTPEETLFFAYTHSDRNAVELCLTAEGYRFSYGPPKNPDIQFIGKDGSIGYIDMGKERGFAAQQGDKTYWLDINQYAEYALMVSQPNIYGRITWSKELESYGWGFNTQLGVRDLPAFAYAAE